MKKYAKQTALALAMALTVTSVAPATASAASKPQYKKEYNAVQKGKSYAYTVKNIKKGTKVKWSLVGTGKKYVSFNKSKAVYSETTKAAKTKTYSTNKIYIRKNTSKVVKVVVKASVTGKNGKKYSVTDKIAIAKTAAKPTATPATTASTAPSTTPSTAPSTTPAATATGAATATPSVAPTATGAATATPSVAPSASTTPSTAPTATASTNPSATPAATATTTPSAAPVVTNGAITVTSNATGASVKVLNGTTVVATGTIADGKAVLPKVANGNYVVEVSATGFITATKAVVVNGDVTVDVQLEATKEFTAKQTGRQTILVTGTNLSDKVADYTVKRGNISVAIDSVKLGTDKTTATLTTVSSSLAEGDYTIELGTQKYAFKAEAEKTAKIELIGTNLVLTADNADTATIGYKVSNQFGERVAVSASNINVTSSFGVAKVKKEATRTEDGVIIVNVNTIATPLNTKGTIVLVDGTTGLSANAAVTLSAAAAVEKITVAGIYKDFEDSEKATKVESLDTNAETGKYAIVLKAYDQYGNENADVCTPGAVTVTAAGNTGIDRDWNKEDLNKDYKVTIGQETYVAIPLTWEKDLVAGSTSVTIVGNKKGLLDTVMLTVTKAVAVESIKLAPAETLYNGTKSEVSYIAKDSKGNEVTDYNTLKATAVEFSVDGLNWERQKDGSAKLYYTPAVDDITTSDTASQPIVVTTKVGTNIDVANFTIYNAKKAKAIVGVDKGTALATVVSNGAVTLTAENIMFQDQYGNVLTDDEAVKVRPTVKVVNDGDIKGFKENAINEKNTVTAKDDKLVGLKAAQEAGKTRLKFVLWDTEKNEEMKNSDYAITVQSVGINDISEFAVADMGQLYLKAGTDTKAVSGNAIELKVTGKVGSTTVALTSADYTVLTPEHIGESAGKIYAKGTDLILDNDKKASKTETLEIVIGNKVGTSIKKDVVVSSVDPKATTVALKDGKEFVLDVAKNSEMSANKAVYNVESAEKEAEGLLEAKDQYDNKYLENARFQFTNLPEGYEVKDNNTTNAKLVVPADAKGTTTVGVTVTFASGVTYTDTLIINVTNLTPAQ